jgi:hypothetical protein
VQRACLLTREMGLGGEQEKWRHSHLLSMAPCVFVFMGLAPELLGHISEYFGLRYPFSVAQRC